MGIERDAERIRDAAMAASTAKEVKHVGRPDAGSSAFDGTQSKAPLAGTTKPEKKDSPSVSIKPNDDNSKGSGSVKYFICSSKEQGSVNY